MPENHRFPRFQHIAARTATKYRTMAYVTIRPGEDAFGRCAFCSPCVRIRRFIVAIGIRTSGMIHSSRPAYPIDTAAVPLVLGFHPGRDDLKKPGKATR